MRKLSFINFYLLPFWSTNFFLIGILIKYTDNYFSKCISGFRNPLGGLEPSSIKTHSDVCMSYLSAHIFAMAIRPDRIIFLALKFYINYHSKRVQVLFKHFHYSFNNEMLFSCLRSVKKSSYHRWPTNLCIYTTNIYFKLKIIFSFFNSALRRHFSIYGTMLSCGLRK